ncbi:fasting-inducible integral membrane protein tm6p1-related [Anaeramoeba flamelloides]|uniref:Fasting-inducible integral membrane protein tm6p1-related n=1 Tax=Anaeramoeba flamelloides TaxID=1746091 RepID=A0AAV8AHD7_9EUKA|nr:fasting-inducible integral membrane protein tm6p1-related [Anaeramoeba flamelloides]KAJ6237113.1 fasting-inducible integral membrane protein tm6p1-related [Anaeramoeba flamelloides]
MKTKTILKINIKLILNLLSVLPIFGIVTGVSLCKTLKHLPPRIAFPTVSMSENVAPEKQILQLIFVIAGISYFVFSYLYYNYEGKPKIVDRFSSFLQRTLQVSAALFGFFLILQSLSPLQDNWNSDLEEFSTRKNFQWQTVVHFYSAICMFFMGFLHMTAYTIFTTVYNKQVCKTLVYKIRFLTFIVFTLSAIVMLYLVTVELVWNRFGKDIGISVADANFFGKTEWVSVIGCIFHFFTFRLDAENQEILIQSIGN